MLDAKLIDDNLENIDVAILEDELREYSSITEENSKSLLWKSTYE